MLHAESLLPLSLAGLSDRSTAARFLTVLLARASTQRLA